MLTIVGFEQQIDLISTSRKRGECMINMAEGKLRHSIKCTKILGSHCPSFMALVSRILLGSSHVD